MNRSAERDRARARRRKRRRAEWPTATTWDDRILERLNPILARDLLTTGNSIVPLLTVAVATFVLIRIGAHMLPPDESAESLFGRQGFDDLSLLVTRICWALVPFSTFLSMREEVTSATAEHLLLSGLTPSRIVRGKVQSALLLSVAFVALAAPAFAFSFALHGVSLPTLLAAFGFGLLGVVALATFAVALACACQDIRPRALPVAIAAGLFGGLALVVDPLVPELVATLDAAINARRWFAVGAIALGTTFAAGTLWLAGAAPLAHRHDNRSSGFRAIGLALPVAAGLLLWTTVPRPQLAQLAPFTAIVVLVATAPIWAGAATEGCDRIPRRHASVARWVRVTAAPFAPGGGNGLIWALLLCATLALIGFGLPALYPHAGTATTGPDLRAMLAVSLLYAALYCGLGSIVRAILDDRRDPRARWLSRATLALCAVASWTVPLILNGIRGIRSIEWNLGHFLNPVTTLAQVAREGVRPDLLACLAVTAALLWLASAPRVIGAIRTAWRGPEPHPDEPGPRAEATS